MTAADLGPLSEVPAGARIPYATGPLQFGELSVPTGPGPHPVVILIHGGVWMAEYGLEHLRALARALRDAGNAVWNIEYRRVGDTGGGWPGTFVDVAAATDHLPCLAAAHSLDLGRVCVMGHSAGGQLALWVAGRNVHPDAGELRCAQPLALRGVIALAPATELSALSERGAFNGIVDRLLGGSPAVYPDRYRAVSPSARLPLGVPQTVIVGARDDTWKWHTDAYIAAATAANDPGISLIVIDEAGHFELINPDADAWVRVRTAVADSLS